jgi:scyllo-inositol 2-dehydrogenase (NADP+)
MTKKRICLIGGGNITNLRHIPGLARCGDATVVGVIGAEQQAAASTASRVGTPNVHVVDPSVSYAEQIASLAWFRDADAVIVGTPPQTHHAVVKACLTQGKHVLTEKPMTMDREEALDLLNTADTHDRVLSVMHNFQFANGVQRLEHAIGSGTLGRLVSFYQVQFTSRNRRLPRWYKELPLGLFYDEASHFFYLLRRLGGPIEILDAFGHFGPDLADKTPMMMNVEMRAGQIPVHMSINFNAPVCEWLFVVAGEDKMAVYDFFRDILIIVRNDRQHYALDILRTSMTLSLHHWLGFVANGIRLVTGNLYYGVDVVIGKFLRSIDEGRADPEISAERGLETVEAMRRVSELVNKRNARHAAPAPEAA